MIDHNYNRKRRLLIFHPALAPYRVDQFNFLNEKFDLTIVFLFDNVWNHPFNQARLQKELHCDVRYLLRGPRHKGQVLRWGMLRMIQTISPDLIVGYEYSCTTLFLILLKTLRIVRIPIGSMVDDSLEICQNVQSLARRVSRWCSLPFLDFLAVLSPLVANYYSETLQFDSKKIVVSPIIQDSIRLRANANRLEEIAQGYVESYSLRGKKVVLFVGRFIPEKALVKFIESTAPLLQSHSEIRLLFVGDGSERAAILNSIQKHGLATSILLPGRFEGDELRAWYLCASGFVLPSTYEPFGAVVNEALAFGLQVLCSKYAGSASIINPTRGILFDPHSIQETQAQLSTFLQILSAVDHIDLNSRMPLINLDYDQLNLEWSKLYE